MVKPQEMHFQLAALQRQRDQALYAQVIAEARVAILEAELSQVREAGASEVSVWNRTPERAEALARDLGARAVAVPGAADLLVNWTSVGLQAGPGVERSATHAYGLNQLGLTFDQLGEYSYVADLVYRLGSTP